MRKVSVRKLWLVGLLLVPLLAFLFIHYSQSTNMNPNNASPERYSIKLGEDGKQLAARYPKFTREVVQPAGLNFYKIEPDDRGTSAVLHFEHGKHSFEFPNMMAFTGTQDMDLNEGISAYSLDFSVPPRNKTPHDEARRYILNIIKTLKTAGWKVNIDRSSPRVRGKEAFELLINDNQFGVYHLDPDYEPTIEEWMQIEDRTRWHFYADNVFLEVYFQRDRHAKDPSKGGYLLSMDIVSGETYYRGAGEDRLRWRERWPEIERENAKTRWDAEYQAARQCFHIDFDYQDPPLPPDFKYTPPKPSGWDKASYERARVDCVAPGKTQSESAPSAPKRLPLKSKVTSAVNCPQSGHWECATDAPGITEHRRFIAAGQPMPYGITQRPAKGMSGLFGKQEDDTVELTWTLLAYGNDAS